MPVGRRQVPVNGRRGSVSFLIAAAGGPRRGTTEARLRGDGESLVD